LSPGREVRSREDNGRGESGEDIGREGLRGDRDDVEGRSRADDSFDSLPS
jgi:hypothetical protein